jgi:hypothetical protein
MSKNISGDQKHLSREDWLEFINPKIIIKKPYFYFIQNMNVLKFLCIFCFNFKNYCITVKTHKVERNVHLTHLLVYLQTRVFRAGMRLVQMNNQTTFFRLINSIFYYQS